MAVRRVLTSASAVWMEESAVVFSDAEATAFSAIWR
jgi:hypothetical protein